METLLLSLQTISHVLNVSQLTIRRWIEKGEFPPPLRIGRSIRWPKHVFEQWRAEKIGKEYVSMNTSVGPVLFTKVECSFIAVDGTGTMWSVFEVPSGFEVIPFGTTTCETEDGPVLVCCQDKSLPRISMTEALAKMERR